MTHRRIIIRLLFTTLALCCFLPWLSTPMNKYRLVHFFPLPAHSLADPGSCILIILIILLALTAIVRIELAAWASRLILPIAIFFAINLACNHRQDMVNHLRLDYDQTNRIPEYFKYAKPDNHRAPLDNDFLLLNIQRIETDVFNFKLTNLWTIVLRSLGSAWFSVFFFSSTLIYMTPVWISSAKARWIYRGVLVILCLGMPFRPVMADVYLNLASDEYRNRSSEMAVKYLKKAAYWDKNMTDFPSYVRLTGQVQIWNNYIDTPQVLLAKADTSVHNGQLAAAMTYFDLSVNAGLSSELLKKVITDSYWQIGHEDLQRANIPRSNLIWELMAQNAEGQDAYLYLIHYYNGLGGKPAASLADELAENLLPNCSNRLVRADLYAYWGCAKNRLSESDMFIKMFRSSLDAFSMAKIINYRAQKALIGY